MRTPAARRIAALALWCVLPVAPLAAQTIQLVDDAKLPRFEVVSVKPGDPNADRAMIGFPPGAFRQTDMPLFNAIFSAFGVRPYQVAPLPEFAQRERFTIEARMPAGGSRADGPLMLRALLIDRFKLRYHIDHKQGDGFNLSLARADGRLGPQLRRSSVDCAARLAARAENKSVDPLPAGAAECGIRNGPGQINLGGLPVSLLVQMLSNQVGKPVIDRTGLSGNYDVELRFALGSAGPPRADGQAALPDDAPSVFTAVQEQLGLKLVPGEAPIDTLVIDHIERPDPD